MHAELPGEKRHDAGMNTDGELFADLVADITLGVPEKIADDPDAGPALFTRFLELEEQTVRNADASAGEPLLNTSSLFLLLRPVKESSL
jgi:hypothetical protein